VNTSSCHSMTETEGRNPGKENSIFVARQPIFDCDGQVFGYELLYRSNNTQSATFTDGSTATAELVINSFVEFGIDHITNGKHAFINLTREYITGDIPIPFDPRLIVLEILEDIPADEAILAGVRKLTDRGFTLALDDFLLGDHNQALIPHAKIIKIDIMGMSLDEISAEVERLRDFNVKLLAEKVETRDEFEHCMALGFDYFQGYFFSKPTIIEGKQLQANQLSLLEIIAKLQAPDCEISELEEIIRHDVGISFKLLKIINSSYYSLSKKVESVQHALILLGKDALKNWITLICFSMVENKPDELIALSLVTGKMCEELADTEGVNRASAFTVGLFSMLDVLMDTALEELLDSLPLSSDIKDALLKREGKLGQLLRAVEGYEKGDWSAMENLQTHDEDLNSIYLKAVETADRLTNRNVE
jgi:EAL and modified HD-GYP domain-containing signal transduction protein